MTYRYKDRATGRQRKETVSGHEFIRRFLIHVLPKGFHRIRHYGLLASSARKASLALARELLNVAPPPEDDAWRCPHELPGQDGAPTPAPVTRQKMRHEWR